MVYLQFWQQTRNLFSRISKVSAASYRYISLWAGIIGPLVLFLTDNISVALDPGYDLIKMSISDLALGPTGWLSRLGFGIFALFLFLEIRRLKLFVPANYKTRTAEVLSMLSVAGFVVLAIFTANAPGEHTLHGTVHDTTTFFIAGLFTLGCVFYGLGFKGAPGWGGFYTYTMVVVGITLVCAIIRIFMPQHWNFFGLFERILLWNGVIWFEAVGVNILVLSRRTHLTGSH